MKQSRLGRLLVLMCVLIVVRWLVPNAPTPHAPVQEAVSEAVVRPATAVPVVTSVMSVAQAAAPPVDASTDTDTPGNAFAVRRPVIVAPAPVPPLPSLQTAFVGPPAPPPPVAELPPPPFKVIGTWDDGKAPGVFVSTPNGTLLARNGTVLMAEYRVTALTAQLLSLEHLTSKREYRLSVPRVAGQ